MRETLTLITNFISGWLRSSAAPAENLDRSIAAAASAHIAARRALAVAVAEETREIARRESLTLKVTDLDRGRRLARVGSALNGAASLSHPGHDCLSEAETALEQINADNADARAIRQEMAPQADRLIERLSDHGFGRPVAVSAADAMAGLRMMAAAPVLIESGLEINAQP
jgi:hypothetical protein